MCRQILVAVIGVTVLVGCGARSPVAPETALPDQQMAQLSGPTQEGPYRLWGEWTFYLNADHDRVDVVPRRQGRFHLNALKFLEEYCTDCLKITSITNNGDGTIDLQVRISHPFPGHPQYTGFDVKGIIMFNGSREFQQYTPPKYPVPAVFRTSWRVLGDPELLNADGYSYRWNPWYESGSDLPIFNYWPGKYSKGTPTAHVNGYLNFYSNEERHMFETGAIVIHSYRIWLPPGPVVAGYAVEACWEPPLVMPVTNPIEDFPITANQPEAYHFKCVINEGEPVTVEDPCCGWSVAEARGEMDFWYLVPETIPDSFWVETWCCPELNEFLGGAVTIECDGPPNWRCMGPYEFYMGPDGHYQLVAFQSHVWADEYPIPYTAVDLYEVVIDFH